MEKESSRQIGFVTEDNMTARRPSINVGAGKIEDGVFGVAISLDPKAKVSLDGKLTPGFVLEPWRARLLAYSLLHQAEAMEHGLESSAGV